MNPADIESFIQTVRELRAAQRAYFNKATRSQATLIAAKQLETQVDQMLARAGELNGDLYV